MAEDVVVTALAKALTLLTDYVAEREVPDQIADNDVNALESVAAYLHDVPVQDRPRLVALVGPRFAYHCGLIEEEPSD